MGHAYDYSFDLSLTLGPKFLKMLHYLHLLVLASDGPADPCKFNEALMRRDCITLYADLLKPSC